MKIEVGEYTVVQNVESGRVFGGKPRYGHIYGNYYLPLVKDQELVLALAKEIKALRANPLYTFIDSISAFSQEARILQLEQERDTYKDRAEKAESMARHMEQVIANARVLLTTWHACVDQLG